MEYDDYDNVCSMGRAGPRGPGALTELPDQCQTQPATLDTHYTLQGKYLILSGCSVSKFFYSPKSVTLWFLAICAQFTSNIVTPMTTILKGAHDIWTAPNADGEPYKCILLLLVFIAVHFARQG